jgi:sugar-specific transcriptional regulator TrmB
MIDFLKKLGLKQSEAALYLACLELGEASAVATIAKKAAVNRSTAYYLLEDLVKRGLILSSQAKNYQYYQAQPPHKLVQYLKEESSRLKRLASEAEDMLPELEAHYGGIAGRPRVYFYEGEEGLIRVYEETLNAKSEILAYASDESNQEAIAWYFPNYYKRRAAKGIPIRVLFTDSQKDRERHALDSVEMRTSRLIPDDRFNFTSEVNFFDDKIMIADWKEKLGIVIESKEIAKVFKQTFELAWEASEKYHKKIVKDHNGGKAV